MLAFRVRYFLAKGLVDFLLAIELQISMRGVGFFGPYGMANAVDDIHGA